MRWRRLWPRSLLARIGLAVVIAFVGLPLAATAIALVATAAALVVAMGWPLLLGFGIYKLAGGGRRTVPLPPAVPAVRPVPPPPPPPAMAPAPDPVVRLPADVGEHAERIRAKATSLLQQSARFPAGSRNLHLVQRTLDEYLPATLYSYAALPPGSDDWVAGPDGRTTVQVLRDQLTLLETKLDEMAGDLWRSDVQRLLANERFLEEHFGRRESDELKIP